MLPVKLQAIRDELFRKNIDDELLRKSHHIMMCKYGYIPLEEFKKMPIPTFLSLMDCILTDIEAENRALKKIRR